MARLFTGPRGGRVTTAVLRDATHWDEVVTKLGYEHLRRHDYADGRVMPTLGRLPCSAMVNGLKLSA